jgi:glycosyltransferase involved in cell wall biosynthesis
MTVKVALIANSPISIKSMGGGDRILIELARSWQRLGAQLTLFGPPEAKAVCDLGGINVAFVETSNFDVKKLGTIRTYLRRILKAILGQQYFGSYDVIYSASESLPDVALSARIKKQNRTAVWVIGFYLIAPNPFLGEVNFVLNNLLQYAQQKMSLVLMKCFGTDAVFVLGGDDKKYLEGLGFKNILRIGGGVDLNFINSIPEQEKVYDACFIGRISKQKGVDDLLKVWREVVNQKSKARLAFIGWGHPGQQETLLDEIKREGLHKNIEYFGFLDGAEKYRILKSSKLLLFPSKYESFGIVVLEALAAGVPVVAYGLSVLRENFKEGVAFVGIGDVSGLASQCRFFVEHQDERDSLALLGRKLAQNFDWEKVGADTYNYIVDQFSSPKS